MTLARAAERQLAPIYIETPHLYLRPLNTADASERFAAWFEQKEVCEGLNLKPQRKSKADIETYIAKFDQRSNILLGIFDKAVDLLVGLLTVQIDWGSKRYLANTAVGEAAYRHRGVMLEVSAPFRAYFFDTLGLDVMTATVLATNKPIIAYLAKTGWTLNRVLKAQVRSNIDGSAVDLCLYSITREAWRQWMAANPETLNAMLTAAAPRDKE